MLCRHGACATYPFLCKSQGLSHFQRVCRPVCVASPYPIEALLYDCALMRIKTTLAA